MRREPKGTKVAAGKLKITFGLCAFFSLNALPSYAQSVPTEFQGVWAPDCVAATASPQTDLYYVIGTAYFIDASMSRAATADKIIAFERQNNTFVVSVNVGNDEQEAMQLPDPPSSPDVDIQILIFNIQQDGTLVLAGTFNNQPGDSGAFDLVDQTKDTRPLTRCDASQFADQINTANNATNAPDPPDSWEIAASKVTFAAMPAVDGVQWGP
jgi:hypothetical protein